MYVCMYVCLFDVSGSILIVENAIHPVSPLIVNVSIRIPYQRNAVIPLHGSRARPTIIVGHLNDPVITPDAPCPLATQKTSQLKEIGKLENMAVSFQPIKNIYSGRFYVATLTM